MTEKWPFNDYAEQPQELLWLYTHCCAIGMKHKSDSGKLEHDIALFTAELCALLEKAEEALEFYSGSNHFIPVDPMEWDTVSGEPQNFLEDEANSVTVEDGSVAKQALAAIKQWKET